MKLRLKKILIKPIVVGINIDSCPDFLSDVTPEIPYFFNNIQSIFDNNGVISLILITIDTNTYIFAYLFDQSINLVYEITWNDFPIIVGKVLCEICFIASVRNLLHP